MLIFDIETDGLLPKVSKVHCGVTYDTETGELERFGPDDISKLIIKLKDAKEIGGHNVIGYDIPVLEKLFGVNLYDGKHIEDTLILSRIAYYNLFVIDENSRKLPPKLKGSHGLKAWGYRLNFNKGTYGEQVDAWDKFSESMLDYCEQDVRLNVRLYEKLLSKQVPWEALSVEQDFARIISRQVSYGWLFDVAGAQKLHVELMQEKQDIEDELAEVFTPLYDFIPMNEVNRYTKTGAESKVYLSQIERGAYMDPEKGWGRKQEVWFNPGSRQHIIRWMKEVYNWESPKTTEKGTPVINEDVLKDVDFPEAQLLRKYFLIQKILGMLAEGANGWLRLVDKDHRIHGEVNTLGAVSGRCTHTKPNVAQTPSTRAFKGHECRSLWTVPKGKKIVGADASGLELRMLAHYMAAYDGGEYGEQVVNGDIHTINQEAAGLPTRDNAKTFIYGFLYGAGHAKIGQIVNGSAAQGKKLKDSFLQKLPALKQLTDAVKKASKKGFLTGLSGRKYAIRSEHSALNVLLQGAGAMVMKYYLIELDEELRKKYTPGQQYEFIGNIHDEIQIECDEAIAEDVAKICEYAFGLVEQRLSFRCKLEGEAKIGNTWAETH